MARLVAAAVLVLAVAVRAQDASRTPPEAAPRKRVIGYGDVRPLWDRLRPHLPSTLANVAPGERDAAWQAWTGSHDAGIRARVARGEEDSLVNFWLFGTSFTDLPPARPRDVALHGAGAALADVADRRLDDLLRAVTAPGRNDRARWAGAFLRGRGIDPTTAAGRTRARDLLAGAWKRALTENADVARVLEAANTEGDPVAWMARYADLYRDRGLSSDTSLFSSFAIDSTLGVLAASGGIRAPVRRVAIVGPGLDVINKADGHDFYPEQTIQPFALADSLLRLGLARAGDLTIATFDVSVRVNQHLAAARARAQAGTPYPVHLPLSDGERWSPALVQYWERAGSRIGEPLRASAPPGVKLRAVRIRPEVVTWVTPLDLNVVLERLDHADAFDLVVATNVFIYYDTFQQALAMLNIAHMLRPGGSLLTNQAVAVIPPMKPAIGHDRVVYSDRQFDHVFWYQRL